MDFIGFHPISIHFCTPRHVYVDHSISGVTVSKPGGGLTCSSEPSELAEVLRASESQRVLGRNASKRLENPAETAENRADIEGKGPKIGRK